MSKKLLDLDLEEDEDDQHEEEELKINDEYAERYGNWRRKEEMEKLKNKYGDHLDVFGASDEGSLSGDDDDEESEELDEDAFDEQFFKVYSALKHKNPDIYDQNVKYFDKPIVKEKNEKIIAPSATMTLTDYHQKLISEKDGITEEDLNESKDKPKGYYEELKEIKNEFKTAIQSDNDDDDNDDENDDLFQKKPEDKIKEIKTEKNEKFQLFNSQDKNEDIKFLKNYWSKDNLDENEKYLRDYILNKRYLIEEEDRQDNYESENDNSNHELDDDGEGVGEDEEEQKDEIKVSKYHFEEMDSTQIKRYPRLINSMRDAVTRETRSSKRQEIKERKKREKESELKRLRKLKKEELKERLNKLKEISGNDKLNLDDLDLNILIDDENDFDEKKYDEKMRLLFGDNYYSENDANIGQFERPEFEYDEAIDDDNDDEQYNDYQAEEEIPAKEKKDKKKSKKDKKKKSDKNVEIYEDLIGGDLPTRFRYRIVKGNDFGLTDEEILLADDKELNQWCSLKKICQYRDDDEEMKDIRKYNSKKNNLELKKKILKSLYGDESEEKTEESEGKKKKKRRRKHKKSESEGTSNTTEQNNQMSNKTMKNSRKRKYKKEKKNQSNLSIDRLKAYGLTNKEVKRTKLV